jgi:CHAT domain-containing protein/tetratricopeptide (TPR) repeat protein
MPATRRSKSERGVLGLLWLICFCITLSSRESQSLQPQHTPSQQESNTQSLTTALDQKTSEARQSSARADELRATWKEASLREAIEQYDKASVTWISVSDFANATQSTLKSGDVFFLLNEYPKALERYQKADTLADKTGDWLTKATPMARMARVQSLLGKNDLAQQNLTKAFELFKLHQADRSANVTNAYGETLNSQAEVTYATGNFLKARDQFKNALEVFQNDPSAEARAHLFSGYIAGGIGDPQKAIAEFSESLKLYQQVNDKGGEGLALSALGLSYAFIRDYSRDVDLQRRALEIFRNIGDRHSQVIALNGLGQRYEALNDYLLAFGYYEQALQLLEEIHSVDGMTSTLHQMATIRTKQEKPDEALDLYKHSVQLSHDAKKDRSEAYALNEIAKIYSDQGRHQLALQQYQKVLKFVQSSGDLRGLAMALNAYGDGLLKAGQPQAALDRFRRALSLSDKMGEKELKVSTLHGLALANLKLGSPETALSLIQEALKIVEDERTKVASPEFRASYFSGEQKFYQLGIEIRMQLDRLHPGQEFLADAFLMSEQSRARLLFDLVSEARTTTREITANKLIERERELRGQFQRQAQYKLNLSLGAGNQDEIAAIESQLTQLRADYQEVQAQLRQQYPRFFAGERLAPLSLQQVQHELRDGTMLLEYALGDERSYLLAVTSDSLQSYELPGRKTIEDAARELYRLTTARQVSEQTENYQAQIEKADDAYFETATRLSQMLLEPVADDLVDRRILVVTEGALQHISLEALPVPVGKIAPSESVSGKLLIEQNEVVVLPSISTLIALRNSPQREHSPRKLVAIIADPVFDINDDRVKSDAVQRGVALAAGDQKPEQSPPGARQKRNGTLARLNYASEEADAISSVAPWGTTLVAKGFDATRETAMGPDIEQYRIIHFATHGLVDSEHPELSAIVLSLVDRNGQTTNGLMPLYDIHSLDLSADVTVLSACQTALGKDIKGEGLVGLTHGFLSAGSKSVVASLWKVDDRATAFLMTEFYDSMFQKGMSPSAALRSAKLKVMKDKRWREPYYWAGFVLQGEYTNRIVVARDSWLRVGLLFLGLLLLVAAVLLVIKKRRRQFPPAQTT